MSYPGLHSYLDKFELLCIKFGPPHFSAKFVIFHRDRIAGDYGLAPEPGSTQRNNMINNIPAAEPSTRSHHYLSATRLLGDHQPINLRPSSLSLEMRRDGGEAGDHLLLFNFEPRLYFKMAPCRDCINFKIHSNPTSWRKRQV